MTLSSAIQMPQWQKAGSETPMDHISFPMRPRFAQSIKSTMLSDRHTLTRVVRYAIENSMSALKNARSVDSLTAASYPSVVSDWFIMLSRAFRAVPTGFLRISGDGLWVSKDVMLSPTVLTGNDPDTAVMLRAKCSAAGKVACGPASEQALREVSFEGELLRQAITGDAAFESTGPFASGKALLCVVCAAARQKHKSSCSHSGASVRVSVLEHECAAQHRALGVASARLGELPQSI
jgi:hypothetical protein